MTPSDLQQLVVAISQEFFGKPFRHEARFNNRLRTTGGRYLLRSHDIEINPLMLSEFDEENLVGVIKHELVHYHLHLNGLPYQHRDTAFKQLLKDVSGARYAPKTSKRQVRHLYECGNGHQMERQREVDVTKYVCGRCRQKIYEVTLVKK